MSTINNTLGLRNCSRISRFRMILSNLTLVAAITGLFLANTRLIEAQGPERRLPDGPANSTSSGLTVLEGAGASFPNSLYQDALFAYQYVSNGTRVNYKSIGSGKGKCRIKDPEAECLDDINPKHIDFAGSDLLLSEGDYREYPDLQMLPTVGGAVVPVHNLEGLGSGRNPDLILDRATLAGIFRGSITWWRDPAILRLNPLLQNLIPDSDIRVVCREDKSGTTEIWKKALSEFDPIFKQIIGTSSAGGEAGWPTTSIPGLYRSIAFRDGNHGVTSYILSNKNSIGYAVLGDAMLLQLQKARIVQGNNVAVEANPTSVMYALVEKGLDFHQIPITRDPVVDGCSLEPRSHRYTADLVDTKGPLTWPITGYSYLIIRTGCPQNRLRDGASCDNVKETIKYWRWFYTSKLVKELAGRSGFAALPQVAVDVVLDRLNEVHCDQMPLAANTEISGQTINPKVYGSGSNLAAQIIDLYADTYQGEDGGIQLKYITSETDRNAALVDFHTDNLDPDMELHVMFSVLSSREAKQYFSSPDKAVIPWMTTEYVVICHIPELELSGRESAQTLFLDLQLLIMIRRGAITHWNHPRLVELNPILRDVNKPLLLVTMEGRGRDSKELDYIFDQYVEQYPFSYSNPEYGARVRVEDSYSKVQAVVMETDYSVAIVAQGTALIFGSGMRVQTAEIYPAGGRKPVAPTAKNIQRCFDKPSQQSVDELLTADISSASCYPLSVPLYVVMEKNIKAPEGLSCSDALFPAIQTVKWWHWMLFAQNIAAPVRANNFVHLQDYSQTLIEYADNAMREITCGGKAIITIVKETDSGATFLALTSILVVIAISLVAVLALMAVNKKKLQEDVKALHNQLAAATRTPNKRPPTRGKSVIVNIDDPATPKIRKRPPTRGKSVIVNTDDATILKIRKFLEDISETGKASDKEEAEALINLLQNSKHLIKPPSLHSRLDRLGSLERSSTGQASEAKIGQFLDNITGQNDGILVGRSHSSARMNCELSNISLTRTKSDGAMSFHSNFSNGAGTVRACWIEGGVFPEDLMAMLTPLGEDCFLDVVGLDELTGRRPLATVSLYLIHKFDLVKALGLDEDKLQLFLLAVEEGYSRSNFYHNNLRAADMVARFGALITSCGSEEPFVFSSIQKLAGLLAAAMMDFKHAGRDGSFHIRLADERAVMFNDQHVTENYSLVLGLELMSQPRFNFFEGSRVQERELRSIRGMIIDMVLATDMTRHYEIVSEFEAKLVSQETLELDRRSDQIIALQMFIKVTDLGYFAQPLHQHLFWSKAREQELFSQGDDEKARGLSVSAVMDRKLPGAMEPNFQKGYMDVLVLPLLNSFAQVFPGTEKLADQAEEIMQFWQACHESSSGPNSSSKYVTLLSSSLEELKAELVNQTNERYEKLVGTMMIGALEDDDDDTSSRVSF